MLHSVHPVRLLPPALPLSAHSSLPASPPRRLLPPTHTRTHTHSQAHATLCAPSWHAVCSLLMPCMRSQQTRYTAPPIPCSRACLGRRDVGGWGQGGRDLAETTRA
eukprot:1979464-Rhodomonas_salina.1